MSIHDGWEAVRRGDTVTVDLYYPRSQGDRARFVEVGLSDVRAADTVRISYDFDRDGWRIEQASVFEWSIDDKVCDSGWIEVAFVKAWAKEKNPDEGEG